MMPCCCTRMFDFSHLWLGANNAFDMLRVKSQIEPRVACLLKANRWNCICCVTRMTCRINSSGRSVGISAVALATARLEHVGVWRVAFRWYADQMALIAQLQLNLRVIQKESVHSSCVNQKQQQPASWSVSVSAASLDFPFSRRVSFAIFALQFFTTHSRRHKAQTAIMKPPAFKLCPCTPATAVTLTAIDLVWRCFGSRLRLLVRGSERDVDVSQQLYSPLTRRQKKPCRAPQVQRSASRWINSWCWAVQTIHCAAGLIYTDSCFLSCYVCESAGLALAKSHVKSTQQCVCAMKSLKYDLGTANTVFSGFCFSICPCWLELQQFSPSEIYKKHYKIHLDLTYASTLGPKQVINFTVRVVAAAWIPLNLPQLNSNPNRSWFCAPKFSLEQRKDEKKTKPAYI